MFLKRCQKTAQKKLQLDGYWMIWNENSFFSRTDRENGKGEGSERDDDANVL